MPDRPLRPRPWQPVEKQRLRGARGDSVGSGRRRRLSPVATVGLYGLALAGVAAVVFVTSVHGAVPLARPHLQWWAIAAGWALAESCVVHLEFRRSAHS